MDEPHSLDPVLFGWRLGTTFLFVFLNGFFVAAEFSLVKARSTRLDEMASAGSSRAALARHIHEHLDRYLSSCQLGITLSSLILGWLAEPAIAEALVAGWYAAGFAVEPSAPLVHGVALAIALTIVTVLHMTLGEQAPKIWAIHRAEATAIQVAYPLQWFTLALHPVIVVVNRLSNSMLRAAGLTAEEAEHTPPHSPDELRSILSASARHGAITERQLELAQNILDIIDLEVRHILLPRVDVIYLSLQNSLEENLRIMRESGHSRFPLCQIGLDSVIGFIHAKEVFKRQAAEQTVNLEALARKPIHVSDTQPLSRLIFQLQRSGTHMAVVVDEHGTAVGLAFLEDALEEIVGPIRDEFDSAPDDGVARRPDGTLEMPGALPLPEAADALGLSDWEEEADTIGGHIVALLGRLPRKGDKLTLGRYRVTVAEVTRRRIDRLELKPLAKGEDAEA